MTAQLCDEVLGADFGDRRLNQRLVTVIEELGAQPHLSIPAATDGRAEMEGAYRFFDNDKVSPEKIREPHVAATIERIAQCEIALLVQDTTELDLTRPSRRVHGAGPMDSDVRRGAFHHPLMAFTVDGVPLGTVWQKTWTRESIETSVTKAEKQRRIRATPIEQKESHRWIEGQRAARDIAAACPNTQCVCVSDSEADIYEMFCEPRTAQAAPGSVETQLELVVRACHDRTTTTGHLLSDTRSTEELFSDSVRVSARVAKFKTAKTEKSARAKSRDARMANVEVRSTTVTLKPSPRPDRRLPAVEVNLVLVEEVDPPEGCDPIRWLLVTTLPVATVDDVKQVVDIYCLRWQIEVYFRTLKSGCRVEARQFETLRRVENSLAVYSIIAWRVMYLCRLGRECPNMNCEVVFSQSEWKSICHIHNGTVPAEPPTLNEMIRLIAGFGGYINRPKTEPGTQTLWIGLQQLYCFSLSWDAFGPGS